MSQPTFPASMPPASLALAAAGLPEAPITAATPGAVVPAADATYRARAEAAAEKFEAFFVAEMLKQMRRSASVLAAEDSVFKNPVNRDMLDMTDTLVADSLAGQRAFGIADVILRQLLPDAAAAGGFKVSALPVALSRQGGSAPEAEPARDLPGTP